MIESISVSEDNRKQNPEESYTNKHQRRITCSYGYELLCVNDKFSESFKACLGEDVVYNFINGMMEESKCHRDAKKNFLTKNL